MMDPERRTAILVGALFLVATLAGLIVVVAWAPVLEAEDPVEEAGRIGTALRIGAIFEVVMGVAVAAIALAIYPVVRRFQPTLALGYVTSRAIEGAFILVPALTMLTLWTLSQSPADLVAGEAQALGKAVFALGDWAGYVAVAIVFCLGALMLYYTLYRWRLVPVWLSLWGLLGAVLYLPSALAVMFDQVTLGTILNLPVAINEIVLAIWLMAKGFDAGALASAPYGPDGVRSPAS